MLAHALLLTLGQDEPELDAKTFLRRTVQQVQRAKSFEATLEHSDSSGLFPGAYTQRLRWKGGVGFDIVVTTRGTAPSALPDYYARGDSVTAIYRNMQRRVEPLKARPMTSPGWEVVGGLNMTFLSKTSMLDFLFAEPKPIATGKVVLPPDAQVQTTPVMSYSFGERRKWRDADVREIVAGIDTQPGSTFSIFVHPTNRYVIGVEIPQGDKVGWMIYRDIKINGDMPDDLGQAPGG